jgi:hypothetical protein
MTLGKKNVQSNQVPGDDTLVFKTRETDASKFKYSKIIDIMPLILR